MAVLGKDDFMSRIQGFVGDSTEDSALSFIEDMTDTFNDMQSRGTSNSEWEKKYNELDESWKAKYKARFFAGVDEPPEPKDEPKDEPAIKITFEDLFK